MDYQNKINYKYIIFDLVGVLFKIDTFRLLRNIGLLDSLWYIITHFKNPINTSFTLLDQMAHTQKKDYFAIKYKNYLLPKCVTQWHIGKKTSRQVGNEIYEYIQKMDKQNYFKSKLEKKLVEKMATIIHDTQQIAQNTRPIDKSIKLLKKLKSENKYKLFLLSNIDKETSNLLKSRYKDIFSYFDGMVFSCEANLLKPNREIYQFILDKFHIDPKRTIYIDDQLENVMAADDLGITGILFKNPTDTQKKLKKIGIL